MPAADPILRPAAEIATLRARAAELKAGRARLANVIRLYDAADEAATKRKAAGPGAHDYMKLTFEFSAAMARASDARRALTESDLAPETPHG